MSVYVYLVVPVLVVAAWCVYLWLRQRQPTSLESGIEDFQREMRALAPDPDAPSARRRPGRDRPVER
ncbi:MAG: hypothetical protein HYX34_11300 [Actinobacteria bacterium]|nr:hypothetical protein [Actinomycetota bacterium]